MSVIFPAISHQGDNTLFNQFAQQAFAALAHPCASGGQAQGETGNGARPSPAAAFQHQVKSDWIVSSFR